MNKFRKTALNLSAFALLGLSTLNGAAAAETTCRGMGKHVIDSDLRFSLTHNQIPGELAVSTHKLRVAGSQYQLESTSQAKGFLALLYSGQLTQKSEGLVDAQLGITPLYYSEQRGKKPVAESMLNAQTQQVLFKKNGESAPYEKGMQDRISMVYQIAARLRCNAELKTGASLSMRVMSTGRVSNEVFILKKPEELTLDLGQGGRKVNALQFESKPEKADDEIVRIWYAKDMNWQPVKIEIQDAEGKTLIQTLISMGKQQP